MFSKRMVIIAGSFVLFAASVAMLAVNSRTQAVSSVAGEITLGLLSPFQNAITCITRSTRDVWNNYFCLVAAAEENNRLRRELSRALQKNNQLREISLSNERLRNLLNFKESTAYRVLPAEVISKDPSPWFKTLVIDKGRSQGVEKGLPVVTPEGVAGQVIETSARYARVLLIIDQNHAVDTLSQRTRARGMVKGATTGNCSFEFVQRKEKVRVGDILVSSGLDGVFPKGLRVGYVSGVVRRNAGIFQDVSVEPYVDFAKLEEVMVLLDPFRPEFNE